MSAPWDDVARRVADFFDPAKPNTPVALHFVAHAAEDVPEDVREQVRNILMTPPGLALQQRILDVLENAAVDVYGHLEVVIPLLARYPITPYTYAVTPSILRGPRPEDGKVTQLARQGVTALLNLCAETPGGDVPLIHAANLDGTMKAFHEGIVDMTPPSDEQIVRILDDIASVIGAGGRIYVHCEAGKARTGVAVACERMAMEGWSPADALTEAVNFGCTVPMQVEYIREFGAKLVARDLARRAGQIAPSPQLGQYPLLVPGSVKATPQQLKATIDSVNAGRGGLQ